jgi:hypothetical protein
MGKTNRQWHEEHHMPTNASVEQRLQWHLLHAKNCACRPIPQSILALMQSRGIVAEAASPDLTRH